MDRSTITNDSLVLSEAEAIEFFAFLISATRTQIDEPAQYASMRLLSAAEILRDFVKPRVSPATREMLDETMELITYAQMNTNDTESYTVTVDALCRQVAQHLVDQTGIGEKAS